MTETLFSIVVPTRNRASLLRSAIASVLAQDFRDYELVICDNASSDSTADVVRSLADARLRYVRRSAVLSMPDSWEAAWGEANGRYVLYLSDDDMLVPDLLRYLAELVSKRAPDLVSWSGALHYTDDSPEDDMRSSIRIPVGRAALESHDGPVLAVDLHRFVDRIWYPHLMNCCAKRSTFETIRVKHGRLFFPPAPDYSFMSIAAQELPSWLVSKAPLYLVGRTGLSIGSSFHERASNGDVQRGFLSEFRDDPLGPCGCRAPVVPNYVAATLLNVAEARRSRGLPAVSIDLAAYVYAVGYYMGRQRSHLSEFDRHAGELLALARGVGLDCESTAKALLNPDTRAAPRDRDPLRRAARKMLSALGKGDSDSPPFGGRWMDDQWLGRSLLIPLKNIAVTSPIDLAVRLPAITKALEPLSSPRVSSSAK